MSFLPSPVNLLLVNLPGWMNREQRLSIAYLQAENRVLRELLGKMHLLLNDDQHRPKGPTLGRNGLLASGSLFTPDTILHGRRRLIA